MGEQELLFPVKMLWKWKHRKLFRDMMDTGKGKEDQVWECVREGYAEGGDGSPDLP